jgi:hypothetical protein
MTMHRMNSYWDAHYASVEAAEYKMMHEYLGDGASRRICRETREEKLDPHESLYGAAIR